MDNRCAQGTIGTSRPTPSKGALAIDIQNILQADHDIVGRKNANLAQVARIVLEEGEHILTPKGFAVTTNGFESVLEHNGLTGHVRSLFDHSKGRSALVAESKRLKSLMQKAQLPSEVKASIIKSYAQLSADLGSRRPYVAVRSSATSEDLPSASFAGQYESFLFVAGENALLRRVVDCMASLFNPRAVDYWVKVNSETRTPGMAVGVQQMISGVTSGVMATEIESYHNVVKIDANWGIGESVVSGAADVDEYLVDKQTGDVVRNRVGHKTLMFAKAKSQGLVRKPVPRHLQDRASLGHKAIRTLSAYAAAIEHHFCGPMDVEWTLAKGGHVFVLQARPLTNHPGG